jgi:hypothetical protein
MTVLRLIPMIAAHAEADFVSPSIVTHRVDRLLLACSADVAHMQFDGS